MKLFDKIFKKNKNYYKINTGQENNLTIMLAPKKEVKLNSKIFIPDNFCVVILSKEQLLDVIPSGEYELTGLSIPKTCKINKLDKPTKKGYKTKFFCDFYYVNLNICKIHNEFEIKKIKINVNFSLTFKIKEAKKFLKFLINEKVCFNDKFASQFLTFSLSQVIYYYFLDNKVVTQENLHKFVNNKLNSIGVELLDFEFNQNSNIKNDISIQITKENLKDSIVIEKIYQEDFLSEKNNQNQLEIKNLDDNQQKLEENIKNHNSLVDLNDIKSENITYFVCDECGARLSKDSQICYNCKKSFVLKNLCEYCGREIEKGQFVCPHCNSVLIGN